jgi:hypothetical protein
MLPEPLHEREHVTVPPHPAGESLEIAKCIDR